MDKIPFTTILDSEAVLDNLLIKLSIPIIKEDRVHRAYSLLRNFEKIRIDPIQSSAYLKKYNQTGEINYSLFDLMAIYNILPHLQNETKQILKSKLTKILNGSLVTLETDQNNEPRNTLFELLMLSYLKKVGLDAHLKDPNPDIQVNVNHKVYYIQCKRIFRLTNSSVKRNVRDAATQLELDLRGKPENYFGIIALSVEPKQGNGLIASSKIEALNILDKDLQNICQIYGRFWQDPKIVKNERIVGVFLHHLVTSFLANEDVHMSNGSFLLINNTRYPINKYFGIMEKDFAHLSKLRS